MTSPIEPQSMSSVPPHSNESAPSLVPLLQRILETSAPAFRAQLPDVSLSDETALRKALFPVTRGYTYLNHAAVGPVPAPVAWAAHQAFEGLSLRGSIEMEGRDAQVDVRQRFGRLINAPAECIAFTKNVSDAFMTIAHGLEWRPGDNIVTVRGEFPANVYPWLNLAEQGVETRFAPTRDGRLMMDDLAALIDDQTRLVSISYVQFSSGMRADVAAIAKLAHAHGALCAVDGIQALGALRLDATAADLDFVASGSAKWLLSPAHVGLLYVRPDFLPKMRVSRRGWLSVTMPFDFFDYEQPLRDDAGRLEGGSNNWLSLVTLDAALALLQVNDADAIERRVLELAARVRGGLARLGFDITSPEGPNERSAILTFRHRVADPAAADAMVKRLAEDAKIVISARNGLLRVSPHFYNTEHDIDRLLDQLEHLEHVDRLGARA